jgi:hypothetical protein
VLLAGTAILCACEVKEAEDSPERVVQEFVLRMRSVHGEGTTARSAHDLLWGEGKNNLAERAKRATAVSDRKVAPEEMLAPSHFTLRFEPKRYSARVEGNWAVVRVTGSDPGERAEVKCVQEDGRWRVVLELPAPPPISRRQTDDPAPE